LRRLTLPLRQLSRKWRTELITGTWPYRYSSRSNKAITVLLGVFCAEPSER
jgi:hypothetical protein